MIELITSMLGSGGMGALGGILKNTVQDHLDNKRQLKRMEIEREMAQNENSRHYLESMHGKPREMELEGNSSMHVTIFNKKFGYEKAFKKDSIQHSLSSVGWFAAVLMLNAALCWSILILFDAPDVVVWTLDPGASDAHYGFLWGLVDFSFPAKTVYQVTTGSVGWGLAHGLMFIDSLMLTGRRVK